MSLAVLEDLTAVLLTLYVVLLLRGDPPQVTAGDLKIRDHELCTDKDGLTIIYWTAYDCTHMSPNCSAGNETEGKSKSA